MFIHPDVRSLHDRSIITPLLRPDNQPRFTLDMSGVAGLLGGDDAVAAMTAVHVYGNQRWLGWYNNPGSFQIAKRFGRFAKSTSLRGIFSRNLSTKSLSKSVYMDPALLFEADGANFKGPKFRAAHSGTVIEETGYVASLFMKECATWDSEGAVVPGRRTQPVGITIADLGHASASQMYPACSSVFTILSAILPIATSIGMCVLCAVCEDWCASSLILIGIVTNGISCLILGSADFVFTHPEPAKCLPAGDGILSSDKDIVLLRGTEGAVNSITRGEFSLRFSSEIHHNLIHCCSILFLVQCFVQLFLISQASLFGQTMFLISLGVSALYNAWLSSSDKDEVHRKLLFKGVLDNPTVTKYTLGTRTTAVVFTLLVLQLQDPMKLLDELLPNDTKVWKQWKSTISQQLGHPRDHSFLVERKVGDMVGFTQQEQNLLNLLYDDARAAYNGYKDYLGVDSL